LTSKNLQGNLDFHFWSEVAEPINIGAFAKILSIQLQKKMFQLDAENVWENRWWRSKANKQSYFSCEKEACN